MKCIVILIAKRLTWPTERVRPSGRTHRCVRNQANGGAIEKQAFQSRLYSSKNVFGPLQSIGWRCCISPPGPEVALSQFWQIQKCSILNFWDSRRGSLAVWQSLSWKSLTRSLAVGIDCSGSHSATSPRVLGEFEFFLALGTKSQEFIKGVHIWSQFTRRAHAASYEFTSSIKRNQKRQETFRLFHF